MALVAALSTAAWPRWAAAQGPDRTGTETLDVAGLVVSVQTGEPVAGAGVSIEGTWIRTLTNEDGRFVLRGIPRGERTWVIEALGYATWEQPLAVEHLDQLRIGLLARPVALEEIRVTVDRLEARRKLAPYSVHTATREDLRSSAAIDAADLARSRMPWVMTACPAGGGGARPVGALSAAEAPDESTLQDAGQPMSSPMDLCIRYRGAVTRPGVCLDDRPIPLAFLLAYGAAEVHAIDYIGGPKPQIRVYTERFLESGRPIRPIAFGCR